MSDASCKAQFLQLVTGKWIELEALSSVGGHKIADS